MTDNYMEELQKRYDGFHISEFKLAILLLDGNKRVWNLCK